MTPDLPENVAAAETWLKHRALPAVEGEGGDHKTLAAAAMCRSYGLSEGAALELMLEHFNPRCEPPWEAEELAIKVANAYRYATSPPGNVTPAGRAGFVPVEQAKPEGDEHEVRSGRFRVADREGLERTPAPEWLVEDVLPRDAYAILAGRQGSYKTFIALDLALGAATGARGDGRPWPAVARPGAVLFCLGEGRAGLLRRVQAWEGRHGARGDGLVVADPVPHVREGTVEKLVEGARAFHDAYALVVIDTVARAISGENENDMATATALTALADALRRELGGPTVLALHHTGHEEGGRPRGSSAFLGDADTVLAVARVRRGLAKVTMVKQKDWPEWGEARWVELREEEGSLVPLLGQPPAEEGAAVGRVTLAVVDRHVRAALQRHEGREFSDRALAQVVASEGMAGEGETVDLGISEGQLRTSWLPRLREAGSGAHTRRCYDAVKQRWRWSPAAASDFT